MPEGSIDLADIDYSQPFDPGFVIDIDDLPFNASDKDNDANG